MVFCFFRFIDRNKYIEGLRRYREAPHHLICRKSYWLILLTPVVVALSIYIRWHT